MTFDRNVFVNCPFDSDYLPLLRPILFCILDLGLEPRIASERLNSGEARVDKIIELIADSRYAIHDLSRLRATRRGEFYRLNMPFELGLDVGARVYGGGEFATKKCLILEAERYRYQAAISDLSNSDIAVHGNEPFDAFSEVRNWLNAELGLGAKGPTLLWGRFNEFMGDDYDLLTAEGYSKSDIQNLPVSELRPRMRDWIGQHPIS